MKNIEPEHWINEINKADERLRNFPNTKGQPEPLKPRAAAMRWALDFARRDLDALSEGDLSNLQRELECFARFEMKEPGLTAGTVSCAPWPTRQQILPTQQWLCATLKAIRARQQFGLTEPAKKWVVFYSTAAGKWKEYYTYNDIDGPGVVELFTLLREQVDALRECKAVADDCPKLFLQDRGNQDYCCRRHQELQGKRVSKAIPPERYGKRGPKPKPAKRPSPQKPGGRHATKTRTR